MLPIKLSPSNLQKLIFGFCLTLATIFIFYRTPVNALQIRITPDNPQLGDTISVLVEVDDTTPPVVSMSNQNFPVYTVADSRTTYRALLPTTPLDQPGKLNIQVTADGETKNFTLGLKDRWFPTQRITLRGGGSKATQLELDQVAAFKKIVTPEKYWDGKFRRPNGGRVSSIYGVRRYYNGKFAQNYYHRGVDYAGPTGSPIIAPAAGQVRLIGWEKDGFRVHGNTVGIDHGQGVLSIFLHLNSISVKEGDFVQPGQIIGTIGSTGASTGPHLHWGLYVNGIAVDPVPWRFQGFQ